MKAQELMANAIRKTENPLAPMIIQDAYGAVDRLAKMLVAGKLDRSLVEAHKIELLSAFTDDELKAYSKRPEFLLALCAMLITALMDYAGDVVKE
jgi:hypothetical protein